MSWPVLREDGGGCQAFPPLLLCSLHWVLYYTLLYSWYRALLCYALVRCAIKDKLVPETLHPDAQRGWPVMKWWDLLPGKAVTAASSLVWDAAGTAKPFLSSSMFSLCNAWWFGTGRATFSNKCPWSLTPSCKRQAVSVIIWWVKLRRDFCVFTFELAQSYISRNPLILYRLNSRGTTGSNTLNMAFRAQLCQVHLCFFPSFPGKEGKFCRWPPRNWRRQQVASEIRPRLNLPDFFFPVIFCFVLFFNKSFPTKKCCASCTFIMFSKSSGSKNFIQHEKTFVM